MTESDNNQCPRCGHRFGDLEMLFWGFSKSGKCPGCGVALGVNANRLLLLGFAGIIAVIYIEQRFSLPSLLGWLALAAFVLVFCLVAIRVQKLEVRE
jgi:ribosomal protein S27AE